MNKPGWKISRNKKALLIIAVGLLGLIIANLFRHNGIFDLQWEGLNWIITLYTIGVVFLCIFANADRATLGKIAGAVGLVGVISLMFTYPMAIVITFGFQAATCTLLQIVVPVPYP